MRRFKKACEKSGIPLRHPQAGVLREAFREAEEEGYRGAQACEEEGPPEMDKDKDKAKKDVKPRY